MGHLGNAEDMLVQLCMQGGGMPSPRMQAAFPSVAARPRHVSQCQQAPSLPLSSRAISLDIPFQRTPRRSASGRPDQTMRPGHVSRVGPLTAQDRYLLLWSIQQGMRKMEANSSMRFAVRGAMGMGRLWR